MKIRHAIPEDSEEVARLQVTTWRSAYAGLISKEYLSGMSIEASAAHWSAGIKRADPDKFLYLVEEIGAKGFVSGGTLRDSIPGYSGEIYALYVELEAQKRGFGKALFDKGCEHLISLGMTTIVVWVLKGNPSLGFYKRMGGEVLKERQTRIGAEEYTEIGLGWFK